MEIGTLGYGNDSNDARICVSVGKKYSIDDIDDCFQAVCKFNRQTIWIYDRICD